jgi:tetratricopeptide (TPR) repeat protein
MLRLLQEDPSPEVAWTIVSLLRQNPDLFTQKLIRQIDTTHARVPVLVVVGRAEFNTNHKRAMDLLYRAVETGTAASENDEGELGIAINILAGRATRSGRIDEALRLRRLAARRAAVMPTGHPVGAALEVLALHADYGPAPDLSTDLARFNRHRNQSEYRYGLGRIFANQRMGLASAACYLAAHAGSRHSMEVRARIGDRLSAVGWNDLAKVEYRAVINGPREDPPLHQINAHLRMAALMSSNDHAIAAGHIQAALDLVVAIPDALVRNLPGGRMAAFDPEELVDRILYHRFMAERAAGRDASAQVAELLQRRSLDTDTVLELVEYFTQRQDHPRAHQVLDGARDRVRAELEAHPSHPGLLNELAWLSARSGLHVQEGYDLALKAVALEPDNAAFIDTLAEAAFRLGKVQMAIELEERALELRPGDAFMIEQLERFRAAAERPQINADERG